MTSVTVIGGGIAGLSAAVFLKHEGINVNLVEASPKFGGRAYSFFDKFIEEEIDNGQHIFASWYLNTFDFLKIIGAEKKLKFQKQLEVNFIDTKGTPFRFKCPGLPAPYHLIAGIMRYKALDFKDRMSIIKIVRTISGRKFSENELKSINTDKLFELTKQSDNLIRYFWKPFIVAVFNAVPEETSAWLFSEMIKICFLKKDGSNLVLPDTFLTELYVEPSLNYLKDNTRILNSRITKINFESDKVTSIITEDNIEIKSDFYISAVPFFDFKNLIGDELFNHDYNGVSELKTSAIINIHHKFETGIDDILQKDFIGTLDSPIQWIFKVKNDRVCNVISCAKELADKSKEELIELSKSEMMKFFPEFKKRKIRSSRVVKEMRATFVPEAASLKLRPKNKTRYNNFFIAGDWTYTGLPAIIEGAVKSSRNCVNEILKIINTKV